MVTGAPYGALGRRSVHRWGYPTAPCLVAAVIWLYAAAAIAFAAVSGYAAIEHSRAGKFQAQVAERDARI